AIHERRGLWAHLLELPLAQETYVGNRGSLRFFPVKCPEARHIKPRNRVHFGTLMDAFLAGYAPARVCVFWPEAR
ncbi:MAG: nuclease, partial [Desulfovibrio sp.]|nr:nuclease [Desulfovibrio sp.]